MKSKPFLTGVLFLWIFISCSDPMDFGQYRDASLTPYVETPFLYLEAPEASINSSPGPVFLNNTFAFEALSEAYVSGILLEGGITYEVENTTSKPLEISIEFLDASGSVLDTETFTVDPAPTPVLRRSVPYGPGWKSLDILTNTVSLRVTGTNLGDSVSTSSEADPRIVLRSTAGFIIRLVA